VNHNKTRFVIAGLQRHADHDKLDDTNYQTGCDQTSVTHVTRICESWSQRSTNATRRLPSDFREKCINYNVMEISTVNLPHYDELTLARREKTYKERHKEYQKLRLRRVPLVHE